MEAKGEQSSQEGISISTVDSLSVILELIYQLKIKDAMQNAVITGKRTDSMRYIQALMRESYITDVPMVEDKLLVGVVFMEDIVSALDCGWTEAPVEERMAKQAIVFEDDMPLPFAIFYLNKYRCGRYPAVNKKNELVEILSSKALAGTLLAEMNREILRLEKLH